MSFLRNTTTLLSATVALTTAGLLASPTAALADGTTPDGFTYTTSGTEATITDYTPGALAVTIPAIIDEGGTLYTVTTIGANAFETKGLTSVVIPNSVTTIGDFAFSDNVLTTVTVPASITVIPDGVFSFNLLTSVTFLGAVTTIGDSAFYSNSLTAVTIPNTVTTIAARAFYNNGLTSVTIPDSVTTIGDYAFRFNAISTLTIGNSVTTIDDWAFANNQLTTVTLPATVTAVGGEAFNVNPGLASVVFNGNAPALADIGVTPFDTTLNPTVFYNYGATGFTNPWAGYRTQALNAPDPTLAATGADINLVPYAAGGAVLILGLVLTTVTTRRRKTVA